MSSRFDLVEGDVVLRDSSGNAIGVVLDGATYRLAVDAKSAVQGEIEAGQMFSVALAVNMASGGADNPLVLLRNPGGSGKTLYLVEIRCGCSVANVGAIYSAFGSPTVTAAGAAITIGRRKLGSAVAPVALAYSLPTISALGTRLATVSSGQNTVACELIQKSSVAVPPGYDLLIAGNPFSNNRESVLTAVWTEK
jgi:hypothetical protein